MSTYSFVSPILKTVKLKALSVHSKKLNKKGAVKTKVNGFLFRTILYSTTRDSPDEFCSNKLQTVFHVLKINIYHQAPRDYYHIERRIRILHPLHEFRVNDHILYRILDGK